MIMGSVIIMSSVAAVRFGAFRVSSEHTIACKAVKYGMMNTA